MRRLRRGVLAVEVASAHLSKTVPNQRVGGTLPTVDAVDNRWQSAAVGTGVSVGSSVGTASGFNPLALHGGSAARYD